MTLSEQEREIMKDAYLQNNITLMQTRKRDIYEAGFIAGLAHNQKRIEELEAKVKELALQLSSSELQSEFKGK